MPTYGLAGQFFGQTRGAQVGHRIRAEDGVQTELGAHLFHSKYFYYVRAADIVSSPCSTRNARVPIVEHDPKVRIALKLNRA